MQGELLQVQGGGEEKPNADQTTSVTAAELMQEGLGGFGNEQKPLKTTQTRALPPAEPRHRAGSAHASAAQSLAHKSLAGSGGAGAAAPARPARPHYHENFDRILNLLILNFPD